ncbi:MAG: SH3 domain-containing protein, partial [Nitrososphaera sp.]|nr:SH3 domain-containing protein [Nitrososphaera sp.]
MRKAVRSLALTFIAFAVWAIEPGDYYVTAPELNERSAPGGGEVLNRVDKGQKLTVYRVQGEWALVTAPGYQERWVTTKGLAKEKPALPAAAPIPKQLQDPRIAADAIPKPGQYGHSQHDVDLLWKGANMMLKKGKCLSIDYGSKSSSKPGIYYVSCGSRNEFFTE